jgi:hypothetical protein
VIARGTHALGVTARALTARGAMGCGALAPLMCAAAMLALAGCGDSSQGAAKKSDAKGWEGAQSTVYMADGYKSGDKAAWEAQLKARVERGQNEYTRTQK